MPTRKRGDTRAPNAGYSCGEVQMPSPQTGSFHVGKTTDLSQSAACSLDPKAWGERTLPAGTSVVRDSRTFGVERAEGRRGKGTKYIQL